ncbi:TIR domain-containing protein [Sorangium sp. So ce136]|uniref:TIR domain-containing protein n=1 Tax=Sorangium sp. So ce136 TaxID=3133284 RepID=UPI003EFD9CAB
MGESYDLGPRLGSYRVSRATDAEIGRLIDEGETALNVLFEDRDILLQESAGNFWLAQYICNKVCAIQEVYETQDAPKVLTFDLLGIRRRLMAELSQRYTPIARTFAKGKKWRPGGNKPYLEVFLALSRIPDSVVTFDKVLNVVAEHRRPGIKAIRNRIAEVIYDPSKPTDLRRQIAFEADVGFSIEDPLFRYFLSNIDVAQLYKDLGIEPEVMEGARRFSYDIGFSFAGETRRIVEAVNAQLKLEDVITFYDFDQQAFLLALDLEHTLRRLYADSCRYFLVFLGEQYSEKVWTKYEKDIMTTGGRKDHIIPVILDDAGAKGAVGIPSTVGRIDLRTQWAEIQKTGTVSDETIHAIRNRCVLPLLEKLDAGNGDV